MKLNHNQKLYWYGIKAKAIKSVGWIILIIGFIVSSLEQNYLYLGISIVGLIIILKGQSQRFDYQRRSGYIVHHGDR